MSQSKPSTIESRGPFALFRYLLIALSLGGGAALLLGAGLPGAQEPESDPAVDEVAEQAEVSSQAFELRVNRAEGPIYRVPIHGVIELGLAPFVERAISEAAEAEASVIILDVDTPGGRVDAAKRIADAVGNSTVPVYAYVNPEASSAGALISIATNGIFMRPTATMGAAAPVDGSGEMAPEKMVSAMRSTMRSLAEARGLDPAIAEAMVDEDLAVPGVIEAGKLLTLTANEAVDLDYARFVEGWDDMLGQLGIAENRVVAMEVNWAERIVRFLSHPVVAPFLLSLGFLGLLVEIKTPGFGVAGGAGILALSLFFGSHLIIGLAGAEGLILFGIGVILLLTEVFIVPGVGILGILGGIGMLVGVYLSLLGGIPSGEDYARASTVLAASLTMIIFSSWFLVRRLPANRRLTRLGIFLGEATDRDTGYTSSVRRKELKGVEGKALTDLRPSGTGLFGDERVDVVSESEWIEAGSPIRITSSEGYRHVVRLVRDSQSGDDSEG
ncbi:MAG: nodulation protein NfeD [Gemmatimonadales bacterium]|nr:MAG: nodulation protein NfeD [Gemmatimonadales bacterium]